MITLDFEGTIYNEKKFRSQLRALFAAFGFDLNSIMRSTAEHAHFSLEKLKELKASSKIKKEIEKKCSRLVDSGARFVYPDALKFINRNSQNLFVLSFGDKDFQKSKIAGSGISDKVSGFAVTQKSKYLNRKVMVKTDIFIDNDVTELNYVRAHYKKIRLILIDRNKQYREKKLGRIKVVGSFSEVKDVTS